MTMWYVMRDRTVKEAVRSYIAIECICLHRQCTIQQCKLYVCVFTHISMYECISERLKENIWKKNTTENKMKWNEMKRNEIQQSSTLNTRDTLASSIQKPFEFNRFCCKVSLLFPDVVVFVVAVVVIAKRCFFFSFSQFYRFSFVRSSLLLLLQLSFQSFWSSLFFFHLFYNINIYRLHIAEVPFKLFACVWMMCTRMHMNIWMDRDRKINKTHKHHPNLSRQLFPNIPYTFSCD